MDLTFYFNDLKNIIENEYKHKAYNLTLIQDSDSYYNARFYYSKLKCILCNDIVYLDIVNCFANVVLNFNKFDNGVYYRIITVTGLTCDELIIKGIIE